MTALILEDSLAQANIISRLIQSLGWKTVHCSTLKDAVSVLRNTEVHALFLDVFVGEFNTITLLPQFRRLAPDRPIILMTAGSNYESIDDTLMSARQARADYVLRKPFSETQLKEIIEGLCREPAGKARRQHILVIDDSPPVRSLTKQIYEVAGYRVSVASSMEDAFKNIDVAHVDLVLCDIFMPGMGGLNGMRHIQSVWPQVHIVAMSAGVEASTTDEDALFAARALGVDAQIKKPFSAESLLEVTRLVLSEPQLVD